MTRRAKGAGSIYKDIDGYTEGLTMTDTREYFHADVHAITNAAADYIKTDAYISVGGARGCSLCTDRTLAEAIAAGHERCAVERIQFDTLEKFARRVRGGDMWIEVARAMEDPRMFQWVGVDA
jgi:hypothetical protein